MISQIATAAIGTETCAGMPARPSAAPIADEVRDADAQVRDQHGARWRSTDQRMPYSSRTSSARPLPVTTPMRAASICTIASETVISTIIHSSS